LFADSVPGAGVGFLIGRRGKEGDKALVGEPNPGQWEEYAENNCVFRFTLPEERRYMCNVSGPYMKFALEEGSAVPPVQSHFYVQSVLDAAKARRVSRLRMRAKPRAALPSAHSTFPSSSTAHRDPGDTRR
jgi:hypothetical protein